MQKLTPGFKNHMRNLDSFRQAVKSLLSKKYIFSAKTRKTLNIEDLSKITFNYLRENSPNSLCHF